MKYSYILVRKADDNLFSYRPLVRNSINWFLLKWSTAFSQIVKRDHGTEKVGNHCSG